MTPGTDPTGPYIYSVPLTATGGTFSAVASFSASTTDGTKCPITYEIRESGQTTAYIGPFVTIDSSGDIKYDTDNPFSLTLFVYIKSNS